VGIVEQLAPEFLSAVKSASSVLIGTHLNPDGDALGSALAMSLYLDSLGIRNEVLCHHMPPKNLRFLPGVSRIKQTPKEEKYDLGIVLDLDSLERLGSTESFFASCEKTIFIDHHVPHDAPGDIRIVDTTAPATAVILTRLFLQLGVEITSDIATCLITGIVTDTGSFRFRNTSPESLSLASKLLEQGGDINLVSEQVFQSKPISSARLLGFALERMELECNDQICWSVLTIEDFERNHAVDEDTEGFVNELLSIETVQIAAILREPKRGKIRCSIRSRGTYDVAAVARIFGGGGHRNAAGCNFEGPLEEVIDRLVTELKRCLESS
jgi:phosphoesterase RecJ-like protein